ncbi:MAG TPA: stage II sporulation protein M [Caulobacteraceae bacterium]
MNGGLRSLRFRADREADWKALEGLLAKAEGGRAAQLSADELMRIPLLYRSVISALSVARATSLDASLVAYLESLATRAYFFVYGARSRLSERLARFFRHDWPAAVRSLWRETAIAAAILTAGVAVAFVLVWNNPDWFGSILPAALAQGRDPTASTAFLREALYQQTSKNGEGLSFFATFLFTHNAGVSILAFALGFAFCAPTALLMADNGLGMGALMALYASRGLLMPLGGWLAIHGTTELFATVIAGGAGFRIGWAVIFPGRLTRLEAARRAGHTAGTAMAGVVVMLVAAGVLEGVGRQSIRIDTARYAIGAIMLVLWLVYFYAPRRLPR